MTVNVVFTGPAFDAAGSALLRADLINACTVKGNLNVQRAVRSDTDVLVASRIDTVKARAADRQGIAVLSYREFVANFLIGVPIQTGGAFDHHVDKGTKAPTLPAQQELEVADVL